MLFLNQVLLVGNLTKDPELRYTPNGTAVATLRVAVNTPYRTKTGERTSETCFVNVIVWDKQAEHCNQYLSKGSRVFIDGRLQSRSWEGQDGQKRNTIEVRANRVQFMDAAPQRQSVSADPMGFAAQNPDGVDFNDIDPNPTEDSDLPF